MGAASDQVDKPELDFEPDSLPGREDLIEQVHKCDITEMRMKLRHLQVDLALSREQIAERQKLVATRQKTVKQLNEENGAMVEKLKMLERERSHLLVDLAAAQSANTG
jgi:hypothetical protein